MIDHREALSSTWRPSRYIESVPHLVLVVDWCSSFKNTIIVSSQRLLVLSISSSCSLLFPQGLPQISFFLAAGYPHTPYIFLRVIPTYPIRCGILIATDIEVVDNGSVLINSWHRAYIVLEIALRLPTFSILLIQSPSTSMLAKSFWFMIAFTQDTVEPTCMFSVIDQSEYRSKSIWPRDISYSFMLHTLRQIKSLGASLLHQTVLIILCNRSI